MLSKSEWQVLTNMIDDAPILADAKLRLHHVIDRELVHEEVQAKEAAWTAFKRGAQAVGYPHEPSKEIDDPLWQPVRAIFEKWWSEQPQ